MVAKRSGLSYAWVIVGIVIIGMTLIYGIRHSFSVFFPSILEEFGWNRGSTAFMLSLNLLVYGFLAPITGSLGDRWKPHRIMPIGLIILGLATMGCAFAQELWHFYLLLGFIAPIGMACAGWPLLAPALANWFARKRGLAMGLAQIGAGLSFTYGLYAEFAILQLGWRHAYFVLAGTLWVILLPLYFLFFHFRPEDKGLKPYGAEELVIARSESPESSATNHAISCDWTLRQALGTYQLWMLMLAYFLFWGIGTYLVIAHQVKFAEDVGYSSTFAVSIFALYGFSLIGGQLSCGISDRIGREVTITFASALMIIALIALVSVKDSSQPWLLYVYAICFGYGGGFFTPTLTAGAADIFHGKHFGAIAGILLTGMGIGGVIGPWLGGYIYDVTGSYTSAFSLCMAAFFLACTAFWIAAPKNAAKLNARRMKRPTPSG
ncbi:MAG: MFS transporter [Dehalococcoidia bacterium]|nr:MAG: MFS transporter [Dehalococcoidia bacterium]